MKLIMSAALIAVMFGFSGCGVDEARLAQLTGDKNFEQVKAAYKTAVFYDKKEDVDVYKYYLKKNQDKVTGFDFEMYAKKIDQDKATKKAEKEAYEASERLRPDYVEKIQIPRKYHQE